MERRAKINTNDQICVINHVYTQMCLLCYQSIGQYDTKAHDGFCDGLHLDGVVFPVAPVFNPATGAQRVITPGRITATQ